MDSQNIEAVFPDLEPEHVKTIENRLDSVYSSLEKQSAAVEITAQVEADLIRVAFFSEFIISGIIRNPDILRELIESEDLFKTYSPQTYDNKLAKKISEATEISAAREILLQVKQYESIRIAWRDLTMAADLDETLEDLSGLADAIVQAAFTCMVWHEAQSYGWPVDCNGNAVSIIVLGMGKLGARELNFSSDIDLIFVYPQEGYTNGEQVISNGEFFTAVCRKFLKLFSAGSHALNFYRVDTRLRPFGDGGPLIMSSQAFEEYYQAQGREWERYAMIKARPIAGDLEAGHSLLKSLNAFVYRRYFDYGSFDSFRDMKQRIALQVKNKQLRHNIKLGAGGIREIEFFGQLFQLIRGGVEPKLQERKILKVLEILYRQGGIGKTPYQELTRAYDFLRKVENRLQAYADRQTHDIPQKPEQQAVLARSMGYASWQAFSQALSDHMEKVHHHFSLLLVTDDDSEKDRELEQLKELWVNINDPQFAASAVSIHGFEAPEKVLGLLRMLEAHPNTRKLTPNGRKKLARLVPRLIKKIGEQPNPEDLLVQLIDLVLTIERRTCYLSLLIENQAALDTLITLAQKSPWIIRFLSGHPALLDELMSPDTLYAPPGREALEKEMAERMAKVPPNDLEFLLEELCLFRQVNMLRVAAADISGNYPLMKVSDHLTYIAETVVSQVLASCWQIASQKYGLPPGIEDTRVTHCGFAIIAYGKVGGFEMGYTSDIDFVFLHRGEPGYTSGTEKSVDVTSFYATLGQRIIHALTMHTPAGTLYGADMRLRPGGNSGMIVSHIDGFEEYMEKEAWTWEHQALIRARPVAGDIELCNVFNQVRKKILTAEREPEKLKADVYEMREKMRAQRLKPGKDGFDLKQSPGGIVDIEFLVQFLILKHAHAFEDIVVWTDNIRLLESLDAQGIITARQSEQLQQAYVQMRQKIHHHNLKEAGLLVSQEQFLEHRENVNTLFNAHLAPSSG